jgi:ribose/xylose/arabinose/galactoside ABC-type transport system permease subunit
MRAPMKSQRRARNDPRHPLPLLITIATFLLAYTVCYVPIPGHAVDTRDGNLLTDNAFLGIAAVGMTFVILSGGIDLSVGSVIAFAGVFLAVILRDTSMHPLAAVRAAAGDHHLLRREPWGR